MNASRTELEQRRRFLLDSLRDLERERDAGEIGEDDYESLRDDYTARAAEVLRALAEIEGPDGRTSGPPRPARPNTTTTTTTATTRHSRSRRAVAVVMILGFVLVAGASVFVLAGGRDPGAPLTGSVPETTEGRLALAHQLEGQGRAVDALKVYDTVLKDDPANVEALTYRGWLLKLAGLVDQAQGTLDKAIAADPTYPDAHFFRGMLLFQDRKDAAAAIPELEAYLASNPAPGTVEAVQGVLNQARQAAAAGTPAPAG